MWTALLSAATLIVAQASSALGRECKMTGPVRDWGITGENQQTFNGVSVEWCMNRCLEEKIYDCKSIDYNTANSMCHLSRKDRNDVVLEHGGGWLYYERDCGERNACEVVGPINNWGITGHNTKTINDISMEECYTRCKSENLFHCKSVDYYAPDRRCHLSMADRNSVVLEGGDNWYYFEVQCPKRECKLTKRVDGWGITGHNQATYNSVSLDWCIKRCQDEVLYNCKSIDYNTANNMCHLSRADRNSVTLEIGPGWIYYEMDCSEKNYECKLQGRLEGWGITDNNDQTITDISEEECVAECEKATLFNCDSIDYYTPEKRCHLSRADRSNVVLEAGDNWVYYERECTHFCKLPLDEGTGKKDVTRFYYDAEKNKCKAFTYAGNDGNGNNFKKKKTCKQTCATSVPDECLLTPERGDGSLKPAVWKYYYSSEDNQCAKFKYKGGPSNANSFETKEECVTFCKVHQQ